MTLLFVALTAWYLLGLMGSAIALSVIAADYGWHGEDAVFGLVLAILGPFNFAGAMRFVSERNGS